MTPSHFGASIVGAPLQTNEGAPVALTSSVAPTTPGDTITVTEYSWTVTKDNEPFATGMAETFSFTPDDNGIYVVSLTVTDSTGETATDTETITAINVAPTAGITGPSAVVPGQTATFTLTASDPSTVDQTAPGGFTYKIDWEGDGSIDLTTSGPSGLQVTHVFDSYGSNTVTVTATDKDGGVSAPATLGVQVQTVATGPDPANPGKTALFVGGTDGNDSIHFNPGGRDRGVRVTVNGVKQGSYSPTGAIVVFALGGNDNIQMAGSIQHSARLYGGDGNDRIKAARGPSILDGGAGDDKLIGGKSNDILFGGAGADNLVGGPGDDILIAGSSTTAADDTALGLLLQQWNSGGNYEARVRALASTLTTGPGGSLTDDGVADTLVGASGQDWFLTADTMDTTPGRHANEYLNSPTSPPGGGNGGGNGNGGGHGNGGGNGNGNGNGRR